MYEQGTDPALLKLDQRLRALKQPEKSWLAIGDALRDMEARESKGTDGKPWHEVLATFLRDHGQPVTTGHINKVRRVHRFVRENIDDDVTDENLVADKVQFSALEMAERLNTLDHQAGQTALRDCLDGLTFGEMRSRYETFRDANPELLPPRQLAWLRKRSENSPTAAGQSPDEDMAAAEVRLPAIPEAAHRQSMEALTALWRDAYAQGRADAAEEIAEKDRIITELRKRIGLPSQE